MVADNAGEPEEDYEDKDGDTAGGKEPVGDEHDGKLEAARLGIWD